jgi:pimeloyl-ACP methyl ester carboxylesterase
MSMCVAKRAPSMCTGTGTLLCVISIGLTVSLTPARAWARCSPWDFDCLRKKAPKLPRPSKPGGKKPGRSFDAKALRAALGKLVDAIGAGKRADVGRTLAATRAALGPLGQNAAPALTPLATLKPKGAFKTKAPPCTQRVKDTSRSALEAFVACVVAAAREGSGGPKTDALRVIELARFSLLSYKFADGDDKSNQRFPDGWSKTPVYQRPSKGQGSAVKDTGFRAVAYERPGTPGELAIAFTGSMTLKEDWAEVNSALVRLVHLWPASRAVYDKVVRDLRRARWNLARAGYGQRGLGEGRQYTRNLAILALRLKQAQDFVDEVRRRRPGARLYVTGHSMGGFIAEVIGAYNRKHVTATHTFDAAPGAWHVLGVGAARQGVAVTNHRRVGDVVSVLPTHVGTICTYRFPGKREFDEADWGGRAQGPHHMTTFVKALERGMKPHACKAPRKRPQRHAPRRR